MKKQIPLLIAILLISLMSACKKEKKDSVTLPTDNVKTQTPYPVDSLIAKLIIDDAVINDDYYEFGAIMQFEKSGKITQLGIKVPAEDTYTLTLWRMSDTTIVTTTSIQPDSGQVKYTDIGHVTVNAGEKFMVTMYSDDYYMFYNTTSTTIYPIDLGDVIVTGYGYRTLSAKTYSKADFPDVFPTNYYAGAALLKFE